MQVKKQQLEPEMKQWTGSKLEKEYVKLCCILSHFLFNLYAEYIMQNARLDEAQAEIMIARRNINNLKYTDGRKRRRTKELLDGSARGE